ncbi:retrovirus-related Pol polyprotein from transposon 412 [Trichonephila clavipes]|nr:retrovirus-related Pol polyprotein from transposon 412 [Trichonephila clavipes]
MLFGRDLRLPADLLFSRRPDAPLAPEEYIEKLQAQMEEIHHLARERIGMASEKMKTRYDARAAGHDFHEGDKVWLWNPKRRKGLSEAADQLGRSLHSEAENILQFEEHLLHLPLGLPNFDSIEEGRQEQQDEESLTKAHDIFL